MNFRSFAGAALLSIFSITTAQAAYCPDGTTVAGSTCKIAPDGRYVSGDQPTQIAPNGRYTSGPARITPNGDYIGGSKPMTICPDGSYVSGHCHINPNGTYRGD